jgi:hypothetical protein
MNVPDNRRDYWSDHMTFVSMQHMPLTSAYLCQDCNCVGNCALQCPACASEALMGLAGVLNRELEDDARVTYSRTRIPISALAA